MKNKKPYQHVCSSNLAWRDLLASQPSTSLLANTSLLPAAGNARTDGRMPKSTLRMNLPRRTCRPCRRLEGPELAASHMLGRRGSRRLATPSTRRELKLIQALLYTSSRCLSRDALYPPSRYIQLYTFLSCPQQDIAGLYSIYISEPSSDGNEPAENLMTGITVQTCQTSMSSQVVCPAATDIIIN